MYQTFCFSGRYCFVYTLDIGWPSIQRELETIGTIEDVQVAGFDQVLFVVNGVKISFYTAPRKRIATMQEIPYLNNIRLADIESIGVMKISAGDIEEYIKGLLL